MNEERKLAEFPRIRIIHMIVLTIVTFGMYIPYWFLSRRQALERLQIKLPYVAIKVTVLLFAFSILELFWTSSLISIQRMWGEDILPIQDYPLLLPLHPEDSFLSEFGFLLFTIVNICSSFNIRSGFKKQLSNQPINGWFTFLFHIWYLQRIINKHAALDASEQETA